MTAQPTPTRRPRSWTDDGQDAGAGKWKAIYVLSTLLAIGFGGLLWWLFRPHASTITVIASLIVEDYRGDAFPNPAHARWDVGAAMKELGPGAERGTRIIEPRSLQGEPAITQAINSLSEQLPKHDQQPQDTVVLYLRGQAIADEKDVYLLAGEFDPGTLDAQPASSKDSLAGKVSMRRVFSQLQELKAANVVVLADICDLTSVPKLGLIVNPVPRMLQQVCSELPSTARKRLWVITSTANMQPSHVSHHWRRTLLQSACDYACNRKSNKPGPKSNAMDAKISLAEFYEQVLRFCHTATAGDLAAGAPPRPTAVQTPLLLRSGVAEICQPESKAWQEAQGVQMFVVGQLPTVPAELPTKEESKPDAKAAKPEAKTARWTPPAIPLRAVAYQTPAATSSPTPAPTTAQAKSSENSGGAAPANPPPANSSVAAPQASNSAGNPPQPAASEPAAVQWDADVWLKFWQLRDALAERKVKGGWSPADFAPHIWRQAQADALYYERFHRAGAQIDRSAEMNRLVEGLDQLLSAMSSDRDAAVPSGDNSSHARLANAWNDFRKAPWLDRKTQWDSDLHWAAKDLPAWHALRGQYRSYIDAMSRASAWLDWSNALGRHSENIASLASPLQTISRQLAAAGQRSAMNSPIGSEQTRTLQAAIDELNATLRQELETVLLDKVLDRAKKLTWNDECLAELLLDSPLLSYRQRRALKLRLATNDYQSPGQDDVVAKDAEIPDLLSSANKNEDNQRLLAQRSTWCAAAFQLLSGAADRATGLAQPSGWRVADLNRWGDGYRQALHKLPDLDSAGSASGAARWQRACLAYEKDANRYGDVVADVLLPTTDRRGLVIKTDSTLVRIAETRIPQPVYLDVYTTDGSPLRGGYLSWKLSGDAQANSLAVRCEGQTIAQSEWRPVKTTGSRLALDLASNVDQSEFDRQLEIDVAVSEQASGGDARSVRLTIVPAKPSHVDLYVSERSMADLRRAQPARGAKEKYSSREELLTGNDALRVPAVEGAKALFDFFVVNRFGKPKRVVARMYAIPDQVDSGEPPLGPGTVVGREGRVPPRVLQRAEQAIATGALAPIFESALVELPAATDLDRDRIWDAQSQQFTALARQLTFSDAAAPAAPAGAPGSGPPAAAPLAKSVGRGVLCWIEETDEKKMSLKPRAYWLKWIDAIPANPVTDTVAPIVRVGARSTNASEKIIGWQIETDSRSLDRYGIEKVAVDADVTDRGGAVLETSDITTSELNPGNPKQLMQLRLVAKENQRLDQAAGRLTLGGFPRAVSFQAAFDTGNMERLDDQLSASIVSVDVFAKGSQTAAAPRILGDMRVYPNRIPSPGKPATDVEYQSIAIVAKADLPKINSNAYEVVLSLFQDNSPDPIREQTFPYDRKYSTEILATKEGAIVLSATASDIAHVFPVNNLRGRYRCDVKTHSKGSVAGENSKSSDVVLLFDRTPPQPAKVIVSQNILYLGQSIIFSIAARDAESDVVEADLRIDTNGNEAFDESDAKLASQPRRNGGAWEMVVEAASLAQNVRGKIDIVARTIDMAGNEQTGNLAGSFQWINSLPPAPKKQTPKKSSPKVTAPPKPKLHNVRVTLLLRGVDFPNAKNVVPQGLTAERKQAAGSVWTFTGVPTGDYNVTAAWSGLTGDYEGKTVVSLTDKDGDKDVTLDLKPK